MFRITYSVILSLNSERGKLYENIEKRSDKVFLANLTVIVVIAMLPVFLVTDQVPIYNSLMDYLFNNKSSL